VFLPPWPSPRTVTRGLTAGQQQPWAPDPPRADPAGRDELGVPAADVARLAFDGLAYHHGPQAAAARRRGRGGEGIAGGRQRDRAGAAEAPVTGLEGLAGRAGRRPRPRRADGPQRRGRRDRVACDHVECGPEGRRIGDRRPRGDHCRVVAGDVRDDQSVHGRGQAAAARRLL